MGSSQPSKPYALLKASLELPSTSRSGLGAGSAATARGSLAFPPRSPKHTIQVSGIDRGIHGRIGGRETVRRHEEQLEGRSREDGEEEEKESKRERERVGVGRKAAGLL